MSKVRRFHIELDAGEDCARRLNHTPAEAPMLTARELRCVYIMRETHVEDIVAAAVNLDEGQRRLALRLIEAMADHKRSLLS